jgi:hypothetical protein
VLELGMRIQGYELRVRVGIRVKVRIWVRVREGR